MIFQTNYKSFILQYFDGKSLPYLIENSIYEYIPDTVAYFDAMNIVNISPDSLHFIINVGRECLVHVHYVDINEIWPPIRENVSSGICVISKVYRVISRRVLNAAAYQALRYRTGIRMNVVSF